MHMFKWIRMYERRPLSLRRSRVLKSHVLFTVPTRHSGTPPRKDLAFSDTLASHCTPYTIKYSTHLFSTDYLHIQLFHTPIFNRRIAVHGAMR